MRKNQPEDVFKHIDTKDGNQVLCWPWTGSLSGRDGDRGYFQYDGRRVLAHRFVWELVRGPIPDGMVVRHKCDFPYCCNPFHMELGTKSDNERDKYLRDRAGMPVAIVREIRRLLEVGGVSYTDIARDVSKRFNREVNRPYVSKIALGLRRNHHEGKEMTAAEIIAERNKHVLSCEEIEDGEQDNQQGEDEEDYEGEAG